MARSGLDTEAVVTAAAALADADGLESVTLARLAAQLGVRPPSLYVHVDGLPGLRRRLALRGAQELATGLQAAVAGRAAKDALAAAADTYRRYAVEHPGTYAATQRTTDLEDAETGAAATAALDTLLAVLRGYGLEDERAVHAARVLRSALHGFATLESGDGFGLPLDLDVSFALLVEMLDQGLQAAARE
ncbi:WHG domain-containing protein [Solirubrobacter ginsenosidimutans]|uniref:WHG domain-containing protein n=1 Tax=Solirubrobacter ginsenosidimutans TaxID=490573 RepID=A0A9X3MPX8_9ACTN|nr:TetR-like C-terminal domain-containing protein [Solirubrobacter ginsenosidimutans]MDA0159108.1 WHG domain-containing protein [Solirubrobacter ginsenosidimutans]